MFFYWSSSHLWVCVSGSKNCGDFIITSVLYQQLHFAKFVHNSNYIMNR